MFTGIIEATGMVEGIIRRGEALELQIAIMGDPGGSDFAELTIGESIAVNGVCLTVARLTRNRSFLAYAMPETLRRTALAGLAPGDKVNLERSLRVGGRLGGHLVTGHVDGVGYLEKREEVEEGFLFTIKAPPNVMRYIVEKGSIAVDGVSLTVASCNAEGFTVSIIPHTASVTALGSKRVGEPCNLEADIIGKYVEKLLEPYLNLKEPYLKQQVGASSSLTLDLLHELGY